MLFGSGNTLDSQLETEVIFEGNSDGDMVIDAVLRLTVSDGEDESFEERTVKLFRTDVIYFTKNGTGTRLTPLNPAGGDINASITNANNNNKEAVAIAAGTYNVTFQASENGHIEMKDGVSLFGGYSPTDWSRDISVNVTEIIDNSSDIYISAAVDSESGVTAEKTEINGFTIFIGKGSSSAGIVCRNGSSLTITNNIIQTQVNPDPSNKYQVWGIFIYGILGNPAYAIIKNNFINLGTCDGQDGTGKAFTQCIGIFYPDKDPNETIIENNTLYAGNTDAAVNSKATGITVDLETNGDPETTENIIIRNNLIHAGSALQEGTQSGVTGIYINTSTCYVKIYNNTIYAKNSGKSNEFTYGIHLMDNSNVEIINNIILIEGTTGSGGAEVVMRENTTNPSSFKNNNLFLSSEGYGILYQDNENGEINDFVTPVNGTFTLRDLGNVNYNVIGDDLFEYFYDPNPDSTMEDYNWRLKPTLDNLTLRFGGMDLSAKFTTDKNGKLHTTKNAGSASNNNASGWSIGAYETD